MNNAQFRQRQHCIITLTETVVILATCSLITGCQTTGNVATTGATQTIIPTTATSVSTPAETPTQNGTSATKIALIQADQATRTAGNHWPTITSIPIPTLEPALTPAPGFSGDCAGGDRKYISGGCWSDHRGSDYLFVASQALQTDPTQSWLQVYTATQDLHDLGPRQTYPVPGSPGLLYMSYVNWPRMVLTTQHQDTPNPPFVFNLETRAWETAGLCPIMPLTIQADAVTGLQTRAVISSSLIGTANDSVGWLTWAGDLSDTVLAHSFMLPGDSATYRNPDNLADHTLAVGKWVQGRLPVLSGPASMALTDLRTSHVSVVVPVWDQASGIGASLRYHVSDFVWISFKTYNTVSPPQLEVRYWGRAMCPSSP